MLAHDQIPVYDGDLSKLDSFQGAGGPFAGLMLHPGFAAGCSGCIRNMGRAGPTTGTRLCIRWLSAVEEWKGFNAVCLIV